MKIRTTEIGIKDLFLIGGLVVALSGFYYTTQLRITALEDVETTSRSLPSRLVALEERVKNIDEKIDFLHDAILWSIENETRISSYEESPR
tara:strand:- start:60 stop:332 length:273 start_codon:yes stop_codon:yes gene_type:complete